MKKAALSVVLVLVLMCLVSLPAKAIDDGPLLILNEPKDNFISTTDKIVVSGETEPATRIIVFVNGDSKARISAGSAGIFLTQVPIQSKENIVTVKALSPSGKQGTVSRRVYQLQSGEGMPQLESLIKTIKSFLIFK
jgi:hypothetical protein